MLYLKAVTNLELILNMLAEATTIQFHTVRDSVGFPELKRDANDGGGVAGNARKEIEQKSCEWRKLFRFSKVGSLTFAVYAMPRYRYSIC